LRALSRAGKTTAEITYREIAREVEQLFRVIFRDRQATGRLDPENVEGAIRAALLRVGSHCADAIAAIRAIRCRTFERSPVHVGHTRFRELRTRTFRRPFYHCAHCSRDNIPLMTNRGIELKDRYFGDVDDFRKYGLLRAPAVFSFRTPHVLFLLAAQDRHLDSFRIRKPVIESGWKDHIAVTEHRPQTGSAGPWVIPISLV
jgi:hypothetical protein